MLPAAAVSGFYLAHPDARYFAGGTIGEDPLADYAGRSGIDIAAARRLLAPNLPEVGTEKPFGGAMLGSASRFAESRL
jgi:hypothetical protein